MTSGATGAMHAALLALLNAGDECVVLEPFYGYHVSTLKMMRIEPVVVPLAGPDLGAGRRTAARCDHAADPRDHHQ